MAIKRNTIEVVCTPRITALATATTLGSATRYNASGTIHIPETNARTFVSVRLVAYTRTAAAATPVTTGWRIGVQLGAAAVDDLDTTPATAPSSTSGRNHSILVDRDVTSYFAANFGAGTSQTYQVGIAFATSAATEMGAIAWKLIVTYDYEATGQATRVKTIRIPLQSDTGPMSDAHSEVGTTGLTAAPANQIPALDSFLPEAAKVYRQLVLETEFNDGNVPGSGTTTITPYVKIDAGAEVARAPISKTLANALQVIDHLDLTGSLDTSTVHAVSYRSSVAGRCIWMRPVLIVTYEYDADASTRIMCEAMIPLTAASSDHVPIHGSGVSPGYTTADAVRHVAELVIPETSPTLVQSALMLTVDSTSAPTAFIVRAGDQGYRGYSCGIPGSGLVTHQHLAHRVDHSSGWSLVEGRNELVADFYANHGPALATRHKAHGYALINYTADKPADAGDATHVVNMTGPSYGTSTAALTSTSAILPGVPTYSLQAVMWEYVGHNTGSEGMPFLEAHAGEHAGGDLYVSLDGFPATVTQAGSNRFTTAATRLFRAHDFATDPKMDIAAARRQTVHQIAGGVFLHAWSFWVTYHSQRFTVAGTVTIDGVPAADGKSVDIFAFNTDGTAELVRTVQTSGGLGAFSAQVPDRARAYFASYNNDGKVGRSALDVPV